MKTKWSDPRSARRWLERSAALAIFGALVIVYSELLGARWTEASLPVIDLAAVGQLVQQYEQQVQQLATLYQQVALMKDQIQSITGHYGMGTLTGHVNAWGTVSWQDIIDMVNSGVNPGDAAAVQAYTQARAQYAQSYPALSPALLPQNPRVSAIYSGDYQSAMAGLGMGDQTFNSVQGHLADLQVYKDKINQTDNLKAAVDLNTAVSVKVAQLSAELLRVNAMQLHLQASHQNDVTSGQAAQTEFFAN